MLPEGSYIGIRFASFERSNIQRTPRYLSVMLRNIIDIEIHHPWLQLLPQHRWLHTAPLWGRLLGRKALYQVNPMAVAPTQCGAKMTHLREHAEGVETVSQDGPWDGYCIDLYITWILGDWYIYIYYIYIHVFSGWGVVDIDGSELGEDGQTYGYCYYCFWCCCYSYSYFYCYSYSYYFDYFDYHHYHYHYHYQHYMMKRTTMTTTTKTTTTSITTLTVSTKH